MVANVYDTLDQAHTGILWFKCEQPDCDPRPFSVTIEQFHDADDWIACEYCGKPCISTTTPDWYKKYYLPANPPPVETEELFKEANLLLAEHTYAELLAMAIELNANLQGIDYQTNQLSSSLAWLIVCHKNGLKL